jgi:hypothetical protein
MTRHPLSIIWRWRIEGLRIIRRSWCPKNYWWGNEKPKMVMSGVTLG